MSLNDIDANDDESLSASTQADDVARSAQDLLKRTFPIFAIVASISYFVCVGFNFAPFAYYPLVGEIHTEPQPDTLGPPMFWYGWIIYGALAGAVASLVMLVLPRGAALALNGRLSWLLWGVPVGTVAAITYLLRSFFF